MMLSRMAAATRRKKSCRVCQIHFLSLTNITEDQIHFYIGMFFMVTYNFRLCLIQFYVSFTEPVKFGTTFKFVNFFHLFLVILFDLF